MNQQDRFAFMADEEDYINEFAERIHMYNLGAGWWDGEIDFPWYLTKVQLTITEIAEATEGVRKDLMDDHLPHRKMEEVELADALIRLLDLGYHCGLKYESTNWGMLNFDDLSDLSKTPPALHFMVSREIVHFGCAFFVSKPQNHLYSMCIDALFIVSSILGHDIKAAAEEKFIYNQNRADHKRENRAKEGGKKF